MKLYRLHMKHEAGQSVGFGWYLAKEAAEKARVAWMKDGDGHSAMIEVFQIDTRRAGLLAALNQFAGHADNG
jgi:hypothetical protein